MDLFMKQKPTHRHREQIYGYWGKGWWGGIVREFGIDMYTLLYLKHKQQGPGSLYSIGNYAQYSVTN